MAKAKQTDIEKAYSDYSDNKTEFAKLKTETEGAFDISKAKLGYVTKAIALVPDQLEHDPQLAEDTANDVLNQAKEVVAQLETICKAIPRREELREEIGNYEKRTNQKMTEGMTATDLNARQPFNGEDAPL